MARQQKGARKREKVVPQRTALRASLPWIAGGAALLGFIGLLVYLATQPRLPKVGDHWHARFTVELCGQILPPLPASPGNVHTHGDGAIHVHPENPSEAGRNATLGVFLQSVGITITPDTVQVPGRRAYRNGDPCPGGRAGRLRVLINGSERKDVSSYVIQDGDQIRLVFAP